MYARLNSMMWRWPIGDGTYTTFILADVYKYAGMVGGTTRDGKIAARPQVEFDALSHDGVLWVPFKDLKDSIPREVLHVRRRDVPLPGVGS